MTLSGLFASFAAPVGAALPAPALLSTAALLALSLFACAVAQRQRPSPFRPICLSRRMPRQS